MVVVVEGAVGFGSGCLQGLHSYNPEIIQHQAASMASVVLELIEL